MTQNQENIERALLALPIGKTQVIAWESVTRWSATTWEVGTWGKKSEDLGDSARRILRHGMTVEEYAGYKARVA